MKQVETDVLIVGAGPAGAVSAVLLSRLGIRNIVISKYHSTSPGPRSHITNQRAMEIMRDIGLEEAAIGLATPQNYMGEHVYATSLVGEEFGRIRTWSTHPTNKAAHDLASPSSVCDLPQLYFEPLVVNEASQRGADVRFKTEYLSHAQDDAGVTALLLDHVTGLEYEVRAKYLIGADGARSKVAQDIDLPFKGQMALGDSGSINVEFTADLSSLCDHRRSDMYWMLQAGTGVNGAGVGVLRMVRPWNKWVCVWGYELAKGAPNLCESEAVKIVHKIIGTDKIPVTIGAISSWTINQQYAAKISSGRVFCMGDAIHRHTPMGGLGLNTSIQDSYNLAWKLAMVVKGHAAPTLLESYEVERAPVAQQIVERAFASLATLPPMFHALGIPHSPSEEDISKSLQTLKAPTSEGAASRQALRIAMNATIIGFGGGHGVELNQRYASNAVYSDGTEDPGFARDKELYYQASTRPGAHLPHVWLTTSQRRVSTLDLCGKGRFTLLTGLSGGAWEKAAAKASEMLGITIQVHVIGPGELYVDTYGDFARMAEVDESGALLVRPDLFVAWRAKDASEKHLDQLSVVMQTILGKQRVISPSGPLETVG
ncbi:monooxygenase FAD-binding [Methylocella silvestris BL2]|uniref:Monooxygenase FAD-binding n=1 Tax=Methylocella silvestris (strain DSM 15510 / CIP 108128 / LMG 27833 / NCIMB 13906 / BL2) TaxID=395965 RepID=B8EST8_METSB|nr:FAD-dependent monooxygenase [Methylocella silvestris]ACK50423.1 monooxygenase FAD-binding [Methylocella silvestris BL2]